MICDAKRPYEKTDKTPKKELIKLRNSYSLTQTEFAKKIGAAQAVISRIENGTVNVGIDFLEKTAKAFDKKVEFEIV